MRKRPRSPLDEETLAKRVAAEVVEQVRGVLEKGEVTQATQHPPLWSKIRLFNRLFAGVFPGLVFCSVSVQHPTTPMHPHSHPRKPLGAPGPVVTRGTHNGGKCWVAPGGVLATPFK